MNFKNRLIFSFLAQMDKQIESIWPLTFGRSLALTCQIAHWLVIAEKVNFGNFDNIIAPFGRKAVVPC